MELGHLIAGGFFVAGVTLVGIISYLSRKGNKSESLPQEPKEIQLAHFSIGSYVSGLGSEIKASIVSCIITENDLVFIKGFGGKEIGRFSRNSLVKCTSEGPRVNIDMNDASGQKTNIIFKMFKEENAVQVIQNLQKWKK